MSAAQSVDIANGYFEAEALVALDGAWRDVSGALVQKGLDTKAADPDADVDFLFFHRGERGTRNNGAGENVPCPDTYDELLDSKRRRRSSEQPANSMPGELSH